MGDGGKGQGGAGRRRWARPTASARSERLYPLRLMALATAGNRCCNRSETRGLLTHVGGGG